MRGNQASSKAQSIQDLIAAHMAEGTGQGVRAVIVAQVPPKSVRLEIYIIATFNGQSQSTFPALLNRFLLRVCTSSGDEVHLPHLHTTPTWHSNKPAWVVAQSFPVSEELLESRWEDNKRKMSTNYTIDLESLAELQAFGHEASETFADLESSAQDKEIRDYWVSFVVIIGENKHLNSLLEVGECWEEERASRYSNRDSRGRGS